MFWKSCPFCKGDNLQQWILDILQYPYLFDLILKYIYFQGLMEFLWHKNTYGKL